MRIHRTSRSLPSLTNQHNYVLADWSYLSGSKCQSPQVRIEYTWSIEQDFLISNTSSSSSNVVKAAVVFFITISTSTSCVLKLFDAAETVFRLFSSSSHEKNDRKSKPTDRHYDYLFFFRKGRKFSLKNLPPHSSRVELGWICMENGDREDR